VSIVQVNLLNMLLVLVSCAAAFALPFELFLFSYAVLGPLHYLTQISWMHKRHYFTRSGGRGDWLLLGGLATVVAGARMLDPAWVRFNPYLAYLAFGAAAGMVLAERWRTKLAILAGLAAVAPLLGRWESFALTFGGFLPSIIHVGLFTACFVLVGALKGRDLSGIGLLALFAVCAAACLSVTPDMGGQTLSETAQARYSQGGFTGLNISLAGVFTATPFTEMSQVFHSALGVRIARLIAFCYTYHYLNWFSKTSVIRWHDVPRAWLVGCVAAWLACLLLYAWDYHLGVAVLGFLSLIHVYLEFPLNQRTFATIGQQLLAISGVRATQRM